VRDKLNTKIAQVKQGYCKEVSRGMSYRRKFILSQGNQYIIVCSIYCTMGHQLPLIAIYCTLGAERKKDKAMVKH
jgi:hypothetical protein